MVVAALAGGIPTAAQGPAVGDGRGAGLKLYVFDGGILESDPGRYRLTKEDVGETRLSVAAYLIAHPRGVLLWDTGAVPDGEWTPTGQPVAQRLVLADGAERRVTIRASLASQLAAAGYKAGDVTHLALSHYHWDHTANANAFAGATWLTPAAERDAMFVDKPPGSVRPETYSRAPEQQERRRDGRRTRRLRRRDGDPEAGTRPHPRAPGALREARRRPAACCCRATCTTTRRNARWIATRPSNSTRRRPARHAPASRRS